MEYWNDGEIIGRMEHWNIDDLVKSPDLSP